MPRSAAAVILFRGSGPELEVFLVHRAPELRFFGDFLAFPGGVLDPADREDEAGGNGIENPEDAALRACARRELVEEIQVHLASDDLTSICRICTPEFAPVQYDTVFFLAELPAGQSPTVVHGELVGGGFHRPAEALAAWRAGHLRVVPPAILLLERLVDGHLPRFLAAARALAAGFSAGKLHRVYFSPGVLLACVRTPTLPPATTTNCYLVGHDPLYVVDPGCPDPGEQARLFDLIDGVRTEGARPRAILCSHHHPDHVGAVQATSERYGLPVHAHPLTLDRLEQTTPGLRRGRPLDDGDSLPLGRAPDGAPDWRIEAIFTPGHDRGHLAFRENRYGALLAGDMLSTVATIMIEPPEGHLRTYMASLERLLTIPISTLYVSHGPASPHGHDLIRRFIQHRENRQAALLRSLGEGPDTIDGLLPKVYWDVRVELYPYAVKSLQAGLEMLVEDGIAERGDDGRWRLTGGYTSLPTE